VTCFTSGRRRRLPRRRRRRWILKREAGIAAGVQDYEVALEWSYVIQVARWLKVQPDVQYILSEDPAVRDFLARRANGDR
jgi:carbohydrate-selective porin OprB